MVTGTQRFRKASPCPICAGYDGAPRGQGRRCHGFRSGDGLYAHCSREEHSGALPMEVSSGTYAHRLIGNCRCGVRHDPQPDDRSSRNGHTPRQIDATYDYVDEQGQVLYQAVRYRPKHFSQRRPDGHGHWINNLVGVRRVLYRLPDVLDAIAQGLMICVVEGEADVEALRERGYVATTNAMGAKKWHDEYSETLREAPDIVIFGDNDGDGRAHVVMVDRSLRGVGQIPRLAQLDGLPPHGDVRDWLKTHTQDDLDRVIAEATPIADEDKDTSSLEGWTVFALADAYQPRAAMVEVVEGLLPLPGLPIVYGAPSTLKTLLLMDMLMCLAAGHPWLMPLTAGAGTPRLVRQAPVLWVDFDNGPRRTHERAAAIGRAYDLPVSTPFHYVSMPSPWLDAHKTEGLDPLMAAIERYKAKVVVMDNLLLIKGSVEENSAEMGLVMAHLRLLSERYQNVIMPIHHQRKDPSTGGRAGDRLRGHSSIEAAVDLALLVEREDGSDLITMRSTKTRGADVCPFGAMFTYEHAAGTTALFKARFYGVPLADEHSDRAVEHTIREVLQAHAELLKTELCSRVHGCLPKIGINRIRGVVDRMIAQHHLRRRSAPRGGEYLSGPVKGTPR
jgi:hypothetical protein